MQKEKTSKARNCRTGCFCPLPSSIQRSCCCSWFALHQCRAFCQEKYVHFISIKKGGPSGNATLQDIIHLLYKITDKKKIINTTTNNILIYKSYLQLKKEEKMKNNYPFLFSALKTCNEASLHVLKAKQEKGFSKS